MGTGNGHKVEEMKRDRGGGQLIGTEITVTASTKCGVF